MGTSKLLFVMFFTLLIPFASAGPISVFGSGAFFLDTVTSDSDYWFSFSGSNWVDSVSVNFHSYKMSCVNGCFNSAVIDGIYFPAYNFTFALGDNGYVAGYNQQTNEHAYVSILGYVTQHGCSYANAPCSGALTIDPTPPSTIPEPSTVGLVCSGLGAVAMGVAARRRARSS